MTAPAAGTPNQQPDRDDGLRRMMVWVLVALVCAVVAAALMAHLAIRWFDVP